jgi:hypothetical protein
MIREPLGTPADNQQAASMAIVYVTDGHGGISRILSSDLRIRCADCGAERTVDELSECPKCGRFVCGIKPCNGDCACSKSDAVGRSGLQLVLY